MTAWLDASESGGTCDISLRCSAIAAFRTSYNKNIRHTLQNVLGGVMSLSYISCKKQKKQKETKERKKESKKESK